MDLSLRELERRAAQSGSRADRVAYYRALIRGGDDPLPLYKDLADTFGHKEDIDNYLHHLSNDPDALKAYLAAMPVPVGAYYGHELDYDPSFFFNYEGVKAWINQELDRKRSTISYTQRRNTRDWYNYDVTNVVRVYSNYFVEDVDPEYGLEGWQVGVIADVIVQEHEYFKLAPGAIPLREEPYETTILCEDWFAMPDAPDATPYGNTIIRWNRPSRLWSNSWSFIQHIKEVGPQFARAALLPRLERLNKLGWKNVHRMGDRKAALYMDHGGSIG